MGFFFFFSFIHFCLVFLVFGFFWIDSIKGLHTHSCMCEGAFSFVLFFFRQLKTKCAYDCATRVIERVQRVERGRDSQPLTPTPTFGPPTSPFVQQEASASAAASATAAANPAAFAAASAAAAAAIPGAPTPPPSPTTPPPTPAAAVYGTPYRWGCTLIAYRVDKIPASMRDRPPCDWQGTVPYAYPSEPRSHHHHV